jgi:tetratricopeptide (TPR) repeat protein
VALLQRGERELERGRVDAAVDAFRLALQDEPKLAPAWRGLGTAYVLRHDNDAALAAYQKYLQLSPAADDRADIRRAMSELKSNAHATAEK